MPELLPFEDIDAGGVDSRSNPLNLPKNRALRCLNWCPKQAGFWELRWGYTQVEMSAPAPGAIHSIFSYRQLTGGKFVLFMSGTTLQTLDTATGTVTTPTVRGNPVASNAKGAGFFANNRFHYGNGTDQKFYDGTKWRDSGLPILTPSQLSAISISEGVREVKSTEASTITLTAGASGSFPADTLTGRLIYVALFDTTTNEIGPATIFVSSGRIKMTASSKLTVANMPNLASVNANWIKLIAGTVDGGNAAGFFFLGNAGVSDCHRVGTTLTVTATPAPTTPGEIVLLVGTQNFDGVYKITPIDTTHFSVQLLSPVGADVTGLPNASWRQLVTASNTATSVDVTFPTIDPVYQVNQNLGLAASTIGGPNAGYQFYLSIYNTNGSGHVGNRVTVAGRALQTAYRSNWHLSGLPDLSLIDTEWNILVGRTGDGALVPYPVADNALNWMVVQNGATSAIISFANIDGAHELPTRNGIIPSQCNMFCVAGDYAYAADTASPTIRRSGSFADFRSGVFVGQPEQSWAPNDIDTFPTAEATTGMFEIDQEVFCGTLHDSALSVNLAGIQQWTGPWNVGIAGRRAGTKCGAQGFYWVSGDKQLCTFSQGVPVVASDEYEAAELSQIGDAFLSQVECVYFRNVDKNKEELRIEAQKTDGTPYTIIHDFKLRETYSAPGSIYGQGYASQFQGPLSTAFTSAQVRDSTGKLQIYAGASDGHLYQLYSGANDFGTEYDADLITLINAGPSRPNAPFFDYYGDANVQITLGRNLQSSIADGAQWGFEPPNADANVAQIVPEAEQDFLYRVELDPPEVQRLYIRFQLQSHSADGDLTLNNPIHVPLESYGRIYEIVPAMGDVRGK